jgi:tRNA nucleotidyltransferase (CCA-adding enzyme)
MKTYLVGGAVRDILMGLEPKDRDYVVVGGSPEELLAKGFKAVGAEFPVFLHPETHEEYALARTERKTGPGYNGFAVQFHPSITLEEDLGRRDLTINAIAMESNGCYHDPYKGEQDIKDKILRHVNADAFKEDPVRVLRIARFAARYQHFAVHWETMALCQQMSEDGELNHLTQERVWKELEKGIMEDDPSRMFDVLWSVNALEVILPEVDALANDFHNALEFHTTDSLTVTQWAMNRAADQKLPLEVRFAILLHKLSADDVKAVCDRLKVPNECRELAIALRNEYPNVKRASELTADGLIGILKNLDAFRRPERFESVLRAIECIEHVTDREGLDYQKLEVMRLVKQACDAVNSGEIAATCENKSEIPSKIHAARVAKVEEALKLI